MYRKKQENIYNDIVCLGRRGRQCTDPAREITVCVRLSFRGLHDESSGTALASILEAPTLTDSVEG